MKLDKFYKAVWIGIALIGVISYMDRLQYPQSFWGYSILLGAIVAIIYYQFKKDKSEALAIFAAFYIMLIFGLEDLIFYLTGGGTIPSSMPHLYTHKIIGFISMRLGLNTVTPISLIISVLIGAIITYFITKYLKEKW